MRPATRSLCPRDHRPQRVDNRRNSARLPLYLATRRLRSNPPIIMVPQRSQTRHSHLVWLRLLINTSNTARTAPSLRTLNRRPEHRASCAVAHYTL
jgi:hypothetical protein